MLKRLRLASSPDRARRRDRRDPGDCDRHQHRPQAIIAAALKSFRTPMQNRRADDAGKYDGVMLSLSDGRFERTRRLEHKGIAAMNTLLGEPIGQTLLQLVEIGIAFVLSALIGLKREIRQKSRGSVPIRW